MATTQGQTRPATEAAVQIFVSGNTIATQRQLQEWIREHELRRNQIIAISSNETDIEDGDNVLCLFYRKKSIVPSELPLDNIQFDAFSSGESWDNQLQKANAFRIQDRVPNVVSLSRTPKNVGGARCQTAWYTSEDGHGNTSSIVHSRYDGDWNALASEVLTWLNQYVAPHQLISVSFHEEAHPNTSGKINALICHTGGANPMKLSDSPASTALPVNGLYKMEIVRHEEYERVPDLAVAVINARGGQEGHVVTTTNDSKRNDVFGVIYSWSALEESSVQDSLRPTGCAGCTIF